jgi:iron complex outermembrane receptor protein
MKHQTLRTAVRSALTAGLIAAAGMPVAAFAQTGGSASASPANLGKVEVTGTRIKRTTLVTAQPVTTISHQQIENTGLKSVGAILRQLPSVALTQGPTFGGYESDGSQQIDLRYLGSKRILVLVDGKRWVTTFGGSTDLSTIPISIVDHIQILQNGASALYGSDAIAGVVNIITKKNFNGAEASAYYGIDNGDGHWDGQTEHYDVTLGMSGDRGHFIVTGSYRTANAIPSTDRKFSQSSVPGTGVTRGISATPQGRFVFDPPSGGNPAKPGNPPASYTGLTLQQCPDQNFGTNASPLYLPHCDLTIKRGTSGQNPANYVPFTPYDNYDTQPLMPLTPNQNVKSVYSAGSYNLTPSVAVNLNALYTRRQSANRYEQDQVFYTTPGETIPADQRYNPFDFTLSTTQPIEVAPGVKRPTLSGIYRNFNEFGRKMQVHDLHTFRFDGGFSGDFNLGQTAWDWDADYLYMDTEESSVTTNLVNSLTIATALSGPGICGKIVGCVPLNLFGGQGPNGSGSLSAAQAAYVKYRYESSAEKDLRVLDANLSSSDLYDLPGGPLGFAVGYQHRTISGDEHPDAIEAIKSVHNPQPAQEEQGSFSVDALYAELNVPIASKLPGMNYLGVDGASRWSDYSTFGSTVNSRVGLKYQPIKDLALRGTYAEGFRAADIDELFSPTYISYPNVEDPCSNYNGSAVSPAVQKNCKAAGVPAGYSQVNTQIDALFGGNPKLKPETSVSKTVGLVYSPSQLTGLNIDVGYFNIRLDHTITTISTQELFDNCYQQGQQSACANITRGATGNIILAKARSTNIGGTRTSGEDIDVSYKFPSTAFGDFKLDLQSTHTDEFKLLSPTAHGTAVTKLVGKTRQGFSLPIGVPEWKANLRFNYTYGRLSANVTAHYLSGLTEKCSDSLDNTPLSLVNLGLCSNPNRQNNSLSTNHVGAVTWYDLQVSYATPYNIQVSVGARNLFDNQPPRETRNDYGVAGNPQLYSDLIGRFIYGEIRYRF